MSAAQTIDTAARIEPVRPGLDDAAETFHEASRLAPSTIGADLAGSARLRADALLQKATTRAARRHAHRPAVDLGPTRLPRARLRDVLERRRSGLGERGELPLDRLGVMLAAAYGAAATPLGARRRVPSAGALYPLELYVAAVRVVGLDAGIYHYDPYRHALARLSAADPSSQLLAGVYDAAPIERTAAAVVTTAVFPRIRFKYGQRGYRFALFECGHVAQNLLLAASAVRVPALPYGGFYDRRIDELVGADGLDECSLYLVLLGGA